MRCGHRVDSVRVGCRRFLEGSHGDRVYVMSDEPDHRALHRDDGFGSGAGVTRNYTDAVRGCLFVDLSVDAGVAAGRAGT
tara:strand:+ start:4044 stop:4283 length:240 start_codon:yes stop_codon:yes gene_type:complete